MRKRKLNSGPKRPLNIVQILAIRAVAVIIIISLAVLLIATGLGRVLKNLDYFKVREVMVSEGSDVDLSYLKGENIFALDLPKESGYILEHYSVYRNVILIRIPPDRIFAYFIKRKPIALLNLYRTFSIDQDMVLFEAAGEEAHSELPLITGLETKIFGPKVGKKYNSIKELAFAVNTLKAFRFNKGLRFYKIKKIDVANLNNASVFMGLPRKEASPAGQTQEVPAWIEIKLGEDGIKDRVGILATLLLQAKNGLPKIKYIDLRFKDPVIKLKESNVK